MPEASDARAAWYALPQRVRRGVIQRARRGTGESDTAVREAAVGWAQAVLSAPWPPSLRERFVLWCRVILEVANGPAGMTDDIYVDPDFELLGAVRRAATNILTANR